MLKDVCPGATTSSSLCLPSLETLASLLLKSKPVDIITRTDDVIKALDVWSSCFDRLGVQFRAETGEIPLMSIYQQRSYSHPLLREWHGLHGKRRRM